ncbi:hypothetical protein [Rhodoflexus sp.]
MRYSLFVLLLAMSALPLSAQNLLSDKHPKVRATQVVLDRLLQVFGQPPGDGAAPLLRVHSKNPDSKLILELNYKQGQAVIDMQESLYDLCASQFSSKQQDALAMLLGHELVHLYANHQWITQFGRAQRFTKDPASNSANATAERQADYLGTFYAYLAGYQPYAISESLINAIYTHYRLPDKMEGYPSRQERIETAYESRKDAQELIAAYRTGLLLMATGAYPQAEQAFLYVVKRNEAVGLKGPKEAYNNAATAILWQLIDNMDNSRMPYYLPVESDVRLRKLRDRTSSGYSPAQEQALLNRCMSYLDKALAMDKNYHAALLNWMAARLLAGNPEAVIGKIKEAGSAAATDAAWLTIGAVAHAAVGQESRAAELFEQALKTGAWYAKANQEVFKQKTSYVYKLTTTVRQWVSQDAAMRSNCRPPAPPAAPLIATELQLARNLSDAPLFVRMTYAAKRDAENSPMIVQTSEQKLHVSPHQPAGITTANQLLQTYGEPRAIGSHCWYFPHCGILAELGEAGKLLRLWQVYAEQ